MVSSVVWEENPYIIGRPVYEPELFFGREYLFNFIQDNLNKGSQVILLHGQRRIGKSTVLSHIANFVHLEQFVFVQISLEGQSQKQLSDVLYDLARDIVEHLNLSDEKVVLPTKANLEEDTQIFLNSFLPQVYQAINGKNLVLLLDEFDVLGDSNKDSAVTHFFPYLQSAISRQKKLFIIPVVGRRLDDMPNLLSLFKAPPNQEIGLLDRRSAERLITKPAEGILEYTSEAIDAILQLSAGHPYFTQVICFALFTYAREEQRWLVKSADVDAIVEQAIEIGEAGLAWFRDGLPIPERVLFSAAAEVQQQKLSNLIKEHSTTLGVLKGEPLKLLEDYGVVINEALRKAENKLLEWDFLQRLDVARSSQFNRYKVTVELARRWLIKRYPIRLEIWELEKLYEEITISLYKRANEIRKNGDFSRAIQLYKQVLNLNSNHFHALFEMAEACFDVGDYRQSVELYTRAQQIDPIRNQEGLKQAQQNYNNQIRLQTAENNSKITGNSAGVVIGGATTILDLERFYQACNPSKPLMMGNAVDRQYYIDFASVRGGKIIEALQRTITRISPDTPTCQLFTGQIGCGKSTELLRLKAELEQQKFHVVYFESTQVLNVVDLDVTDIMLAIAGKVSESLEGIKIRLKPTYFVKLFGEIVNFLNTPLGDSELQGELSVGIAKITAKTKESPNLRRRLRDYLEPRTENILQSINQELLYRANQELKQQGKKGLVVIVDNLDRVDIRPLPSGRSLPEHLFIDRGEQLRKLNCHLVYTIPLALTFSNDSVHLQQRLGGGVAPKVLPMIPIRRRTGEIYNPGLALMRQMVLARAFPDIHAIDRLELITELFDSQNTLDRLCLISGGHVHDLLGLLFDCLREQDPPFDRELLEMVIQRHRDFRANPIGIHEWDLIFQVVQEQKVRSDIEYHTLLRSLFVFEYRDQAGAWFAINPVLAETQKFKSWLENTQQQRIFHDT
jgi:tetratricopeptide (TPR) repeat protein